MYFRGDSMSPRTRRTTRHGRAPRFLHSDSMSECRRERHYQDVVAGPRAKQEAQRAGRLGRLAMDGVETFPKGPAFRDRDR
jgi:hypothetical protein